MALEVEYPLVGYHFYVEVQGKLLGAFREATGLTSESEKIEYKASGPKGEEITITQPGRTKYPGHRAQARPDLQHGHAVTGGKRSRTASSRTRRRTARSSSTISRTAKSRAGTSRAPGRLKVEGPASTPATTKSPSNR